MFFKNLRKDINFAKKSDPAARSKFEIWLTYSGVKALSWHRVARFFYKIHFRLLARMISQWAKFRTGIEIHPAAKIAGGVFIDHGEGVVIGETAEIEEEGPLKARSRRPAGYRSGPSRPERGSIPRSREPRALPGNQNRPEAPRGRRGRP